MAYEFQDINPDHLDPTVEILNRGFPERGAHFWKDALNALTRGQRHGLEPPFGCLLVNENEIVGVALTLRSHRGAADGSGQQVINLSSWYIDEPHRWYAPFMLKRMTGDANAVYTDLTPSQSVMEMLPRLGFVQWSEGVILTTLPMALTSYRRDISVVPTEKLSPGELSQADLDILKAHEDLKCLTCVLRHDGKASPLIFQRGSETSKSRASLIYAPSRKLALSALGNICAHLMRHGILTVEINGDESDCPRFSIFRNRKLRKHYRGSLDPDRIDYAFSELVYLGL